MSYHASSIHISSNKTTAYQYGQWYHTIFPFTSKNKRCLINIFRDKMYFVDELSFLNHEEELSLDFLRFTTITLVLSNLLVLYDSDDTSTASIVLQQQFCLKQLQLASKFSVRYEVFFFDLLNVK